MYHNNVMIPLFDSPGMTSVTVIVLLLEVLSLLAMLVNLPFYRRVQRKQDVLFATLYNAPTFLRRHTLLVWLYIATTLLIGIVSLWLFLFQPHLL